MLGHHPRRDRVAESSLGKPVGECGGGGRGQSLGPGERVGVDLPWQPQQRLLKVVRPRVDAEALQLLDPRDEAGGGTPTGLRRRGHGRGHHRMGTQRRGALPGTPPRRCGSLLHLPVVGEVPRRARPVQAHARGRHRVGVTGRDHGAPVTDAFTERVDRAIADGDPAATAAALAGATPQQRRAVADVLTRILRLNRAYSCGLVDQTGSGPASHSVLNRSAAWIAINRSSPGPLLTKPWASPGGLTTT